MAKQRPILVTGAAGFIGSNFVLQWLAAEGTPVVSLDKLTYAGNLGNLEQVSSDERYSFVHGDIAIESWLAICSGNISREPFSTLQPKVMWIAPSMHQMNSSGLT